MNAQIDLIKDIIRELTRLESVPIAERAGDDDFSLPRMIDAGNGESLIVSRELDEGIVRFAKRLMDDDPFLKPKFTHAEWQAIVRRAFGPALVSIDLDDNLEANASNVLERVKKNAIQGTIGKSIREYAFGCSLFSGKDFNPFNIGPVLFEPRGVWLERKHKDGGISTLSQRRIERAWQGGKLRKRKPSFESFAEMDVIDAIGSCQFVCSVTINDLGSEAGREQTLMAARLATTAIALTWQTPSRALNGINLTFDRQPHRRKTLTFIAGKELFSTSSWSHLPHGPYIKSDEWQTVLKEKADIFAVVGEMLGYVISPSGSTVRPKMMSTLFHAFLWFHEACREPFSHIAVAKMAASLDALACGKKSGGILALINARLKMEDNRPIRSGGPTLKNTIERIYNQGRSRLIHGNNEELRSDWSDTKALAEQFGRLCLLLCLDWIANNPNCDDPNQLRLNRN
ncbi:MULTISPECIES: hypothetical protein [unclassified Agrobacterium]|uniref:hypothetical protein n=1 Tax=unclassified Agrobacterium TaxID=2632611 RepID=UPI002449EB97|nr:MULTISPECIES: hypothetical protein [unclassified Agrobacterium]MDH0616856.1 hypothetical protein [Agrobacterium sp. GD03872]MDH0699599.1 hypothetical protein [Agrobacterium sp. GD03871]MDH1062360.1 hypothetical protein [Agrobacterium sp. GD03992]MDH2213694.1 hypothetical protein [Agrobacterium sp. GD03643]MDH2222512.1 hypothetical protein [Agrobacterium sp. GD03638]